MASQDAQWTCGGCRKGSNSPHDHNHKRGSCKFFFDPNQAATNVNPHSKPMSSVDTPVDSSFLERVVAENRARRPVETVLDYNPAEDDNVSVAASESAPDLSCFAVTDETEETEPAPASTPPLRRSRRVPAQRATGSSYDDAAAAYEAVDELAPENVAAAAARGEEPADDAEEEASPPSNASIASRASSRKGRGKRTPDALDKTLAAEDDKRRTWASNVPTGLCPWGCGADLIAPGGVDSATGLMRICKANGRYGILVTHAEACPGVSDLDAAHAELRRGGIRVGSRAMERGEGSTPRRPRNHLLKEEDLSPKTKRIRACGPARPCSRDHGRNRYLAFQAPIRSSFDPARTGN